MKVSDLVRCDQRGTVIEGSRPVNLAAFVIHSRIHQARKDVQAVAHSHSPAGKAWSVFGRKLEPLSQDSCAFYNDHTVYNNYGGVAFELDEGTRIAQSLEHYKAVILQNHGILTVGTTIDAAIWWYITFEKCCQIQLTVESCRREDLKANLITPEEAQKAFEILGNPLLGWLQFQPLYSRIIREQPELLL